jgi:hypothetical protein
MTSTKEIKVAGNQPPPAEFERKPPTSQFGSIKTLYLTFESRVDYDWMDHALPFSPESLHI